MNDTRFVLFYRAVLGRLRRLSFWPFPDRNERNRREKDGAEAFRRERAITSMMFFYGGPLVTDGYHPVCKPHASPPQPWNVSYRIH